MANRKFRRRSDVEEGRAGLDRPKAMPGEDPLSQRAAAGDLRAEDVLALQQTMGNTAVQRLIQRKVEPARSSEADPGVKTGDLQTAYNEAWKYLWGSENARKIYAYVHGLPVTVPVEVGSTDSDAEAARVRWNPWEANIQLNEPNLPGKAQEEGAKIKPSQIVGQSSSAITLLHELGHVRQHQEAKQIDEKAQGKSGDLGELIRKVKSAATPFIQDKAKLQTPDVALVEEDNVTRHERPAGTDLSEPTRAGYFFSGPSARPDLYDEGESAGLIAQLKTAPASLLPSMTAKDEGVTQAPAVARTVKDYFKEILEDVKGAKVTGWKVNKRDELVRLLEGYIRELEAAEAAWAGTKADGGLDVPKWT